MSDIECSFKSERFNVGRVPISSKEEGILKFWNDNKIFRKSLDQRKDSEEFVFYDGPPFATGLPHYGHFVPGTIKDIIPRYQTMKGKYVDRRFGWDCHGLPVEYEMEKELGISGKHEIEAFGIAKFNELSLKFDEPVIYWLFASIPTTK